MKEFIFSKIAYTKNDAAAFKVFFFQICKTLCHGCF